jgi:hypothetical protein
VPCLAERPLGEREDLRGHDREDQDRSGTALMPEGILVDFVLPASIPLPRPRLGETFEDALVRDLDGVTLDHNVKPPFPLVAAGREEHVPIASQVDGLLFVRAGGEVDGILQPNGHEGRDVGATVGSDRRDPEQLGLLERTSGLLPPGRDRAGIAKALSSSVSGCLTATLAAIGLATPSRRRRHGSMCGGNK